MEKKTLVIVCLVMLVVSYFTYDYQEGKRKERVELFTKMERERELAIQDSLNNLRPMNAQLQAEVEKYIDSHSDVRLSGFENLRRLYYFTFSKEENKEIVTLMSGHGINTDRLKGYTRLGRNLIMYYNDKNSINPSLLDESKLLTSTDGLEFYINQLGNSRDTLFFVQKYEIVHKDTANILKPLK